MKKMFVLFLACLLSLSLLAGCVADTSSVSGNVSGGVIDPSTVKIALICDPIGTNPFLTQMVTGLENAKIAYPGLESKAIETEDASLWEDNIRGALQDGFNFIIVAGTQGTDPLNAVATEFPDDAVYILVDDESELDNVKSISFKEQEGAYLIGMIAAHVNPTDKFGAVHANEGQGSYKWRWGYMQGAMAVREELTEENFMFNYTTSYFDTAIAKELALQQAAAGCGFINAASAVADFGTFEAALEKGFYTSGQDEDRTSLDNPYIITTQLKDTGVVIEKVISEYFEGTLTMENELYGVKEGVIGALYITKDGVNPRNEVLTDEIVADVKAAADKIASGELVLTVPIEE